MEKLTIPTKAFGRFIQLFDASFPSGVFVHSFGLEPHVVLGHVQNVNDLRIYFNNLLEDQYIRFEFAFVQTIYNLLEEGSLKKIIKEDEKFAAMQHFELAQASENIGRNYIKHINFNIEKEIVKSYYEAVTLKKSIGNELCVLSAYAYELGLDYKTLLLLWSKKNLISIASASVKISRIKPSEIQQLLFEYDDILESSILSVSKRMMNFNPLFEQVIYQHKHLEPKLFVT
jgi:urease accessory protein